MSLKFRKSSMSYVVLRPLQLVSAKVCYLYRPFDTLIGLDDTSDHRSTSRFIAFLASSQISWSSKKQPIVSRFSTEANYRSFATTTIDLYWCNNVSSIFLAHNPIFHPHTKHIEIDYHFVQENVLCKDISIRYISSKN